METENPLYPLEDMRADEEKIAQELKEQDEKNQAVLDQVQALVCAKAFKQIKEALSESDYTHTYQIVDQPVGKAQDDMFVLGDVFINQTLNGGFSGDEFAGTYSMPLGGGKYFQFHYAC